MIADLILYFSGFLCVCGAVATWYEINPYRKLIGLSVLIGGIMPLVIATGYLDVAILVTLIGPISTVIFILTLTRGKME
ncbi:MAG: DUF2108 domain-containing protein [Methanospirillaceae archaeon]|nr:DUF2108 domain-containing protein [Methanospirillaceae archaeon]